MKGIIALFFLVSSLSLQAQLLLDADGPGSTYALITSKLAPGYNPVESPDCVHGTFGPHVDEIFDATLGQYVFRFFSHVSDDNDRCINFDRQRMEIKTYDKSPDSLLGIVGETVEYKWKFKLPVGFQSSSNFTHIHQLKAVGGTESSHPVVTLTTRKGTPDNLELRHGANTSSSAISTTLLDPIKGEWVGVYEKVTYGELGTAAYDIILTKLSDNSTVLSYSSTSLRMWRTNATFIRPKWGIYRSLNNSADLRNEEVLFANFSIKEINTSVPLDLLSFTAEKQENQVRLDWQTTAEINTLGFEVQRSTNQGEDWEAIGYVKSTNNPSAINNYSLSDLDPALGYNYYRLKQIDIDGRFEIYDAVSIFYDAEGDRFLLYPNPAKQLLNIEATARYLDQEYRILNTAGALVKKFTLTKENDQLDVSELNAGIYFILNENLEKHRFVKL